VIYGSVCSGIEAASVAWEPLGWKPAFFSEIEKFPSAVLEHHYGSNMPGEEYSSNGVPNYGDMTKFKEWPNATIDVLVGGTPCQSFSVAGLRKGLDDPRGNLMLTFGALAERYKPKWVVWENVPGVLSSNGGRDFGTFLKLLGECGYGVAYRVLDAQYCRIHGLERAVPQRRRRVFVVGCLGDWKSAAAVLFEPESLFGNPPSRRKAGQGIAPTTGRGFTQASHGGYREGSCTLKANGGDIGGGSETLIADVSPTIDAAMDAKFGSNQWVDSGQYVLDNPIAFNSREDPEVTFDRSGCLNAGSPQSQAVVYEHHAQDSRVNELKEVCSTVSAKYGTGGGNMPIVASAYDMRGREGGAQLEGPHDTANIRAADGGSSRSYVATHEVAGTMISRQTSGGFSNSIDHAASGYMAVDGAWAVRRLMPIECERLQGFPNGYTQIPWRNKSAENCPDGPRYKALGNSMAVNVMRWIGTRIEMIEKLNKELSA
jgi:DNA (cytosine-5)-methyltransferase 1